MRGCSGIQRRMPYLPDLRIYQMPVKFRKMTKRTINKKIVSIINQYRKELEARGIKVKKILLYGSYARGKARKDSDIDLVVISDDFKNMDLFERHSLLGRARVNISHPMEILGYTEEEISRQKKGSFIYDEVLPNSREF